MNESEIEKAIDRAVWRRLDTDRAYKHAENAEQKAEREAQIEREETARITGRNPS